LKAIDKRTALGAIFSLTLRSSRFLFKAHLIDLRLFFATRFFLIRDDRAEGSALRHQGNVQCANFPLNRTEPGSLAERDTPSRAHWATIFVAIPVQAMPFLVLGGGLLRGRRLHRRQPDPVLAHLAPRVHGGGTDRRREARRAPGRHVRGRFASRFAPLTLAVAGRLGRDRRRVDAVTGAGGTISMLVRDPARPPPTSTSTKTTTA
jgi:hypothetical protein